MKHDIIKQYSHFDTIEFSIVDYCCGEFLENAHRWSIWSKKNICQQILFRWAKSKANVSDQETTLNSGVIVTDGCWLGFSYLAGQAVSSGYIREYTAVMENAKHAAIE